MTYEFRDIYESSIRRHQQRASYWSESGNDEYAKGSMRKAARWQDKQRVMDILLHGQYPKTKVHDFMDRMVQQRMSELADEFANQLFRSPSRFSKAILGSKPKTE